MSFVPIPEEKIEKCSECETEFGLLKAHKHDCESCHKAFCNNCTANRCLMPHKDGEKENTKSSWIPSLLKGGNEADKMHRVCNSCFESLRDQQDELRQKFSK
jgi:hypothetical protein